MFDTNNLVDNKVLAAQLKTLKNRSSIVSSNAFINALLGARFLLPPQALFLSEQVSRVPEVYKAENIQSIVIPKETLMAFPAFEDPSNNHYMMVFTDWDELRKWPAFQVSQQTVVLAYPDLCKMFADQPYMYSGFVINPYGQSLIITRKTIARIKSRLKKAAGTPPRPSRQDDRILLAEPKIFPLDLVVSLRNCMRSRTDVMTAYLMIMMRGGEQSYLIVIDCSGNCEELFERLHECSEPYLKSGQLIDFVPADSSLGQQAINGRIPFFTKWKK